MSDQDDIFLSSKLESIARVFEDNQDCGLVFSNAMVVDENLSITSSDLFSIIWPPFTKRRKRRLRQGEAFKVLVRNRPALGCTIAFRKDLRVFLLPITAEFSHDAWIVKVRRLPDSSLRPHGPFVPSQAASFTSLVSFPFDLIFATSFLPRVNVS